MEGTINGEDAEGDGQVLTGLDDTDLEGIKLKINMTATDIVSGADSTITMAIGIGTKLESLLNRYTDTSDGLVASRVRTFEKQAEQLSNRIADFDARLALKRKRLEEKFRAMEDILGQLNAQSNYLTGQLSSMNSNWAFNSAQ